MIAVSGMMCRVYTEVLENMITDWRIQKKKDFKFTFCPYRCTLHPLFILRNFKHAAKKLKPKKGSPSLHVAFIDFHKAYDTVPRTQIWKYLQQRGAMLAPLLHAIKVAYGDKCYPCGGEKRVHVHPRNTRVKQGCPLSPLPFSLYINEYL